MRPVTTKATRICAVGVLIALAGPAAAQQAYPNKPIRFIVPFPPGGSTDPLARMVGQKMTENWGQPVIVDSRGGGNTLIGTEALAKSPPDGYTIALVTPNLVILPHLYRTLPYDTLKDIAPVATISISLHLLVVHPSVPASNLQEFIALAKSRPGQLNYASSSAGGPTHLAAVLFEMLTGTRMQHVPYKGAGPGLTDLIAGQVQVYFITSLPVIPHIKTGRVRAIAISGETRSAILPQVPTFTEAGLPGYDIEPWFGIVAPGATPTAVVDKLSAEVGRILRMSDVREKLESQGMRPFASTAPQFGALLKSELAKYAKIIKAANIKIEN